MEKVTEEKVFSYHSFLFPFLIKNTGEDGKEFEHIYSNNEFWQKIEKPLDMESGENQFHEALQNYAVDLYFHPEARNVIWGTDSDIVTNYQIRQDKLCKDAEYIIEKEISDDKKKEYHLKIEKIILKVFSTGVAILVIDCANHKYENFEDMILINGYGRRISIPFIPEKKKEGDSHYWRASVCADEITIKLGEQELSAPYRKIIEGVNDRKNCGELEVLRSYIGECITGVLELGNQSEFHYTVGNASGTENIKISPALDEAMYVMCLVNGNLDEYHLSSKKITSKKNVKNSKELYEFAFVDEGECSCQSKEMMNVLMDEHLYDRWIKYGTLYTVTAQAFNCICNYEPSIETFRRHYLQMCVLVLVQHAALISFQNESMELSLGLEKRRCGIKNAKISDLMDLQERFIAFQNQINFEEVSSQEQAIDLYQMLRKANHIEQLNTAIKEQLDSLYDATNTNQDYRFNKWACILAFIALGIDIPTFLYDADGAVALKLVNSQFTSHVIILVVTCLAVIVACCMFSRGKVKNRVERLLQKFRHGKGKK